MKQRFGKLNEKLCTHLIYIRGRLIVQSSDYIWAFASVLI